MRHSADPRAGITDTGNSAVVLESQALVRGFRRIIHENIGGGGAGGGTVTTHSLSLPFLQLCFEYNLPTPPPPRREPVAEEDLMSRQAFWHPSGLEPLIWGPETEPRGKQPMGHGRREDPSKLPVNAMQCHCPPQLRGACAWPATWQANSSRLCCSERTCR